jgi:Reverse transcriptase (RNA-dependent DNA polymerase).
LFQTGFAKGRRTIDIFIIKTSNDKYLTAKKGRLYWCLVDLKKAFDSSNREALRFKMRKIEVSENMLNCIKIMYQDIKFCVKKTSYLVVQLPLPPEGVSQGCSLSTYLFNTFINHIIQFLDTDKTHSPG